MPRVAVFYAASRDPAIAIAAALAATQLVVDRP